MSTTSSQLLIPLLAGATGGAFALLGNLLLHRYISDLELRNEIAKRKIKAIDGAWSAIDGFKVALDAEIKRVVELKRNLGSEDWKTISNSKLGGSNLTIREQADHAMICVESNRIWLTDTQYDSLLSYHQALIKYWRVLSRGESHDMEEILRTIKESRENGVQALRQAIK